MNQFEKTIWLRGSKYEKIYLNPEGNDSDQFGTGVYFTSKYETADNYAMKVEGGEVRAYEINTNKGFYTENNPVNYDKIKELIGYVDKEILNIQLTNWDDDPKKAYFQIFKSICETADNMPDAIQMFEREICNGNRHEFLSCCVAAGVNGIIVSPSREHLSEKWLILYNLKIAYERDVDRRISQLEESLSLRETVNYNFYKDKINIILNPLAEMAYPVEFSMEKLKSLPHYSKRLEYVQSHLQKIASGSARTIFKVDDEKVLKVAKNAKGIAQNEAEADWGTQRYDICANTFDRDDKNYFIEMELARKVTPTQFKQVTGYSIEDIQTFLNLEKQRNTESNTRISPEKKEWMKECYENEWIQNLTRFIYDYGYPYPGDFGRLSTYGLVNREKGEAIVMVDFGLTKDVFQSHYRG